MQGRSQAPTLCNLLLTVVRHSGSRSNASRRVERRYEQTAIAEAIEQYEVTKNQRGRQTGKRLDQPAFGFELSIVPRKFAGRKELAAASP